MSKIRIAAVNRSWGLALCAAGALLCASQTQAADSGKSADSQSTYQRDRAACLRGDTNQDRATCLQEAGAARQESGRGGLTQNSEQAQFERNRLLRCENQPPQDREDCIRRMNGEGTTSGSVQSGGIYRELVTPVDPAKGN